MYPYPYGDFSSVPNDQYQQYQNNGAVPPANPYQAYPHPVAYPAAQQVDPRQWTQPFHPTPFQVPGMPVSATSANPDGSQQQRMWSQVEMERVPEKIRRTRTTPMQAVHGAKDRMPVSRSATVQVSTLQARSRIVKLMVSLRSKNETNLERMIEIMEDGTSKLASMSNDVEQLYARVGRIDRSVENQMERRRVAIQNAGQGAGYPANSQYGSGQGYMQSYTRPNGGGERADDSSAANRSKRRRH
ncbi:hypothetical protein PRZ48_001866 [Zasmidium cellare]|uniref:Uncharacterized protein n=1 Tax=Zasmidium cellare TaxID=395010 RepID=A0ABR0F3S5_ZASCE|nr:hypothetical protein PRZ48_001866 [Zasmidium cellare]